MDGKAIIKEIRKEYKLQQIDEEFAEFLDIAKSVNPKVIVEIGAFKGGSAACFASLTPILISIDEWNGRVDVNKISKKCNYQLISDNSHNDTCKEKLKSLLGANKIDVLFIDGDHSCKGAGQDFDYYKQFVKRGGVIGLHDIKESDYHKKQFCNVHKLWEKIQKDYKKTTTIKRGTIDWGGIGVVYL